MNPLRHNSHRILRKNRAGFSLVELLVVIGLVAAILGILLPILSATRRQAQCVQCAANLRQIGISCSIYVRDWDGKLPNNSYTLGDDPALLNPAPPGGTAGTTAAMSRGYFSTSNLEWFDVVSAINGWPGHRTGAARYAAGEQDSFRASTKYLWCASNDFSDKDPAVWETSYGICVVISQMFNIVASKALPSEGPFDFLAYSRVPNQSQCVFLAEGAFYNYNAEPYDLTNGSLSNVTGFHAVKLRPRAKHLGLNYLFFDGHVALMRTPPHSMGGEFATFSTCDGDSYTITAADDTSFRQMLSTALH